QRCLYVTLHGLPDSRGWYDQSLRGGQQPGSPRATRRTVAFFKAPGGFGYPQTRNPYPHAVAVTAHDRMRLRTSRIVVVKLKGVFHELTFIYRNEKRTYSVNPSFPHVFSGNPVGTRMDPRLKHSGVTDLEIRIISTAIFEGVLK